MILSPARLKTRAQASGVTLLETLLSVIIGAVIIMAMLIYYQTATDKSRATATIKIVGDIGDAVRAYAQSPDYPGNTTVNLATLVSQGLLTGADTVNPWTGTIIVSTSGNYLGISIDNIPAARVHVSDPNFNATTVTGTCAILAAQLSRSLPLPSPGTVTLNKHTYIFSNPVTGGTKITGGSSQSRTFQGAAVCDYTTGTTGTLAVVMDLS